jgi:hypothetical protein
MPQAGSQYDDDHNQIWIQRLIPANNSPAQFDTDLHQLDPLQGRTPDWSPNDSFLTFESRRGGLNGNYAIFIESALTGEALQITGCSLTATMRYGHRTAGALHFSAEFFLPAKVCAVGCRGIAIAPAPAKTGKLGTVAKWRQWRIRNTAGSFRTRFGFGDSS